MNKRPSRHKARRNEHVDLAQDVKRLSEGELLDLVSQNPQPLLLVLDGVQDPQNLGACMRSANAAGVLAVVVPKDRAATLTETARLMACGAAEHTPFVRVTNLRHFLDKLKKQNVWIVGTSDKAKELIFETDLKGPLAIVLGAEGTGMRHLTTETCDFLAHIPMQGEVECLNVSVATGVCLFEALRQRRFSEK